MNRPLWSITRCRSIDFARNISSGGSSTTGRAQIRIKIKWPDVWGTPRHYISILNRLLHILPRKTMRWLLIADPQERFCNKGSVFVTIGEIVEIYRRVSEPKETSDSSVVLPTKTAH